MNIVAIIGLGYVGLPLALAFGKKLKTIGYDVKPEKVESYRQHLDPIGEIPESEFRLAKHLSFTSCPKDLAEADFLIIAVPTPIDGARNPDFGPLVRTSQTVGANMKRGAIVVYESTVYPGATEEVCIPVLEQHSGMRWMCDFHVAYSPERINPGDKEYTLTNIVKVVSGDDSATLDAVAELYASVITAGVFRATSIKVAEAAKVIENTQRVLNIALTNELALICNKVGIDTLEVLEAAGTKWNFLPFRPGLVGGHCIGVDPYYLTYKAEMLGYHPQVILAGRRINDSMGKFVAEQTVKQLIATGNYIKGAKVIVLGLTFKENCPDLRNSRVKDIVNELKSYGIEVYTHDPVALQDEAHEEYPDCYYSWDQLPIAEALIMAVAHDCFLKQDICVYQRLLRDHGCFIDVKSKYDQRLLQSLGFKVWRL